MRKLNALMEYFTFLLQHPFGGPTMTALVHAPKNISAAAVKEHLGHIRPDALTLLDVRQLWEYEEFHLPGASLLPLGELADRLTELPRDKPVLVYCASGKRSAAAAAMLSGQGFGDVSNMLGGIMAWKGASATGAPDTGMGFLTGEESPKQILTLAYAMENGLGEFYQSLAEQTQNAGLKSAFAQLAGFEEKHKLVVYHLFKELCPESVGIEDLAKLATVKAIEGGKSAEEILAETSGFETARQALEMAMSIEAQALDLYMRFAGKAQTENARTVLRDLAKEEQGHLRALATLMDRLPEQRDGKG